MHAGIINTFFALIFAILIVSIIWGFALYFTEFGSQEGMKEAKNIFMGGITLLLVLMIIYAIVSWLRAAVGV